MNGEKEARRDWNHGRATLKSNRIVTRDRAYVAVAILIGSLIMFAAEVV